MATDNGNINLRKVNFLNQSLFVFKCPEKELKKLQKYYKSINWNEVKPRSESKDNKNFRQGKSFIPELKSMHYLEEFKDHNSSKNILRL